ncbi:MAG: BamA/TamA family outer membrane protein [Gemmatimonadaceae bacterium]
MRSGVRAYHAGLLLGVMALAAIAPAAAQRAPAGPDRRCDGDTVTAIEIHSSPAALQGIATSWRGLADVAGLHFTVTQPRVVMAYLLLAVGQPCTERDRSESERLLRLQPYLASATVRTLPDGPGRVRVDVRTEDELPVLAGIRMRGLAPQRLTIGSENVSGMGLTIALSAERGLAYRSGFGVRAVQYGAFGRPYTLAVSAQRYPLGGGWSVEFAHPFLTDLEWNAFHTGAQAMRAYYPVIRPVGQDLALSVRRSTYDVGAVTRIGSGRVVGVVGAALIGEDVHTGAGPVIISDSGLVSVPVDTALGGRFPAFRVTRLTAIGGLRALRFVTVRGFDALTATQDVGRGVQFAAMAGPSMFSSTLNSDIFLSADVYAGLGGSHSFATVRFNGEGRADRASHRWDGVVGNGRLAWYAKPVDLTTQVVSLDFSAIQHLAFPLQLTFRDHDGGLPGYPNATFAGGRRAVVRVEERRLLRPLTPRADVAVGAFVDAGKLWAGDVPYGVTTGVHTAVGVSLLSAVPAGGKRTYRLDLAVPLNRPPGGARWELRFSSADRSQLLWQEPGDVARARAGAAPSNLLSWSPR